ncbi:MAG: hypothetical protein PHI83_09945, partial [Sphaerochaetaceae bacterium]|nr:hypothetical protein [Sphaerochaetaceae bacterium]
MILGLPADIINTNADAKAAAQESERLKTQAAAIPSKDAYVNLNKDTSVLSYMNEAERKQTLADIWEKQQAAQDASSEDTSELKTIDIDDIDQPDNIGEESQDGQVVEGIASSLPTKPIQRLSDGRLRTQESDTYRTNTDGSETHTLKLGSVGTSQRYGTVDYTINGNEITIDSIKTKQGYEEIVADAVTELSRRYEGYNLSWDPETIAQQKVKADLTEANPRGKEFGLNYYDKITDTDAAIRLANGIRKTFPKLSKDEATVAGQILELVAKSQGKTTAQWMTDNFQGFQQKDLGEGKKGAVEFVETEKGARALVYASENADFSTFAHEVFHVVRRTTDQSQSLASAMQEASRTSEFKQYVKEHEQIIHMSAEEAVEILKAFGDKWTVSQEELAATLFESYLRDGATASPKLKNLFQKIADWFVRIYNKIKSTVKMDDRIVSAFDQILGGDTEVSKQFNNASQEADNINGKVDNESEEAGNTLYQSADGRTTVDPRTLVVRRNTTEDGIRKTIEYGGMPMPSLAVSKPDMPHEGYGGITLVGDRALGERLMKNGDIYERDIWSPTVPRPEYKVNKKKLDTYNDNAYKWAKELGIQGETTSSMYSTDWATPENLYDKAGYYNLAMLYGYAKEHGIEYSDHHYTPKAQYDIRIIEAAKKWGEENETNYLDYADREKFAKAIEPAVDAHLNDLFAKIGSDKKKAQWDCMKEYYSSKNYSKLDSILNYSMKYDPNTKELDEKELKEELQSKIDKDSFKKWFYDMISPAYEGPYLKIGNKWEPYNADTMAKAMRRETLKGSTKNSLFGYTPNQAVASDAQALNTRKKLKESEYLLNYIDGFKSMTDEVSKLSEKYISLAHENYKQENSYYGAFDALEWASYAIRDYYRGGRTRQSMINGLEKNYFTATDDLVDAGMAFAEGLKNQPRSYFEAKPKEVMQLSDFTAALVPEDVPQDIVKALEESQLEVIKYSENGRQQAMNEFVSRNNDILFQTVYHGSGADFAKFNLDFAGTGEGGEMFGWGIYTSESMKIA